MFEDISVKFFVYHLSLRLSRPIVCACESENWKDTHKTLGAFSNYCWSSKSFVVSLRHIFSCDFVILLTHAHLSLLDPCSMIWQYRACWISNVLRWFLTFLLTHLPSSLEFFHHKLLSNAYNLRYKVSPLFLQVNNGIKRLKFSEDHPDLHIFLSTAFICLFKSHF